MIPSEAHDIVAACETVNAVSASIARKRRSITTSDRADAKSSPLGGEREPLTFGFEHDPRRMRMTSSMPNDASAGGVWYVTAATVLP